MNFLAPAALALAALAIPLIVLYMLRTRRHRQEVSSVMLWERAGVAVTSAVPRQRLKVTPLLIAQLIALALFVLLLARPFLREASLLGPHTVFVIDTSGSMAMAGRLEEAKTYLTSAAPLFHAVSLEPVESVTRRARSQDERPPEVGFGSLPAGCGGILQFCGLVRVRLVRGLGGEDLHLIEGVPGQLKRLREVVDFRRGPFVAGPTRKGGELLLRVAP